MTFSLPSPLSLLKLPTKTATAAKTSFNIIASLCFLKCFVIFPVCSTSTNYPNYPGTELGGTVLKLRKSKICPCALASSFIKLEIWSFHVADWQRVGKKCTNFKAHVQSHCLLIYAYCLVTFSLWLSST